MAVRDARPASATVDRSAPPVLRVEDLEVVYRIPAGDVRAVDGVSFSLQPGERLGLIGESGSGKTTMATALLRLTRPPGHITGGRVLLGDVDILALDDRSLRGVRLKEIALVPQGAMNSLNPVMRIETQMVDAIVAHEGRQPRGALAERVTAQLARVGLAPQVARRYPHELSGGMKQRVVMAISTVLNPRVIVADEPTSALDVVVQRQVMQALGRLQEGIGSAVVLIGHDMGLVAQFADLVGVMYAGRLVEFGPVDDVLSDPRHPYSRLLIESLPKLTEKGRLVGIPGLPPALLNLPPGCAFSPRCPFVHERCRREEPRTLSVGDRREAACHLYPEHDRLPPLPEGVFLRADQPLADSGPRMEGADEPGRVQAEHELTDAIVEERGARADLPDPARVVTDLAQADVDERVGGPRPGGTA
jgi:peptide/nickel transport system ATP-binding protein